MFCVPTTVNPLLPHPVYTLTNSQCVNTHLYNADGNQATDYSENWSHLKLFMPMNGVFAEQIFPMYGFATGTS